MKSRTDARIKARVAFYVPTINVARLHFPVSVIAERMISASAQRDQRTLSERRRRRGDWNRAPRRW